MTLNSKQKQSLMRIQKHLMMQTVGIVLLFCLQRKLRKIVRTVMSGVPFSLIRKV